MLLFPKPKAMKNLITDIMPEDPCSGDVAGGSALVPGMSLGIFVFERRHSLWLV